MHRVTVVFCNLTMLIICQSKLIVLRSVNNSLLDCCIYLSKCHRRCGCTKCITHLDTCRALLYTHFQTFQIIRCINCFLCIEVSRSYVVPCYNLKSRILCRCINFIHIICIIHSCKISVLRCKQIRHTEYFVYIGKYFKVWCSGNRKVNRTCLSQLNCFCLSTKKLIRIKLNFILVTEFLFNILFKCLHTLVLRVFL